MTEIPAGVVLMGTDLEDLDDVIRREAHLDLPRSWYLKEVPRHEVHVEAFSVSTTPITVGQWLEFARDVDRQPERWDGTDALLPVHDITWVEATQFCEWLGVREGREFDLPTEVQWERAARGDDQRLYPWGDDYDASRCNLKEARIGDYVRVGSFAGGASAFGVLDLVGNVDEWTRTVYAPYDGSPEEVPRVDPHSVDRHVTRGGSYRHSQDLARCARRHAVYPPETGAGFRVVTEGADRAQRSREGR